MKTITVAFLFIISLTVNGQVIDGKLLELAFHGGSNTKNITPGVNKLYMSAEDGYSGRELYVYDKILDSIQQVKDIVPGSQGSIDKNEESFICIGDDLYFVALKQLWKSDGTETGTTMLKNINPSGESHIKNFTIFNGILYFTAYDNTNLYRLWRSDGTTAGTYFLNIPQGPNGTQIYNLTVFNNHLYFVANDGVNDYQLWRSDGTATGSIQMTSLNGTVNWLSIGSSTLLEFNGYLYFYANDGVNGSELWRTDGTLSGTTLFKVINPGPVGSAPFLNGITTANYFVFMASETTSSNYEPWVSDGTVAGTQQLKNIRHNGSSLNTTNKFVSFDNNVFFIANDGVHGNELWKTDGTETGTQLLKDITPGSSNSYVHELTATTNFLVFGARSPGNIYSTLWKSDGTTSGTQELHDIDLIQTSETTLQFVEFQNEVYFPAGTQSSTRNELWATDGTTANTRLFRDIRRDGSTNPVNFSVIDNKLVFIGVSPDYGHELFISNGTNQGTHLIKDIFPGGFGSMYSGTNTEKSFINVNDILYFIANDPTHGREIHRTDGTEQGTYILKDIAPGTADSQYYDSFYASMGNLLFFKANDQVHGREMWVSDGTETGTKMLKDINPGSGMGFNISNIRKHYDGYAILNGELYFSAFDGNQYWIWKTDGTEAGTVPVIHIPSSGPSDGGPIIFGGDNNKFYFGTNHNNTTLATVNQVWVTDGTQQNSSIVYTSTVNTGIRETYVFNGDLFFSASASGIGRTLHKSDGTAQGTIVLSNNISMTQHLQEFNFGFFLECSGYLFFYTNNSHQWWRTDGTPQGTVLLGDFSYPNLNLGDMVCFQDLVFYIEGFRAKSIKVTNGSNINLDFPVELTTNPVWAQIEGLRSLATTNTNLYFIAYTQKEGVELYLARGGTILPCNEPAALTLDWVTETTADISWTASITETGGYNWLLMEDGDDPLIDMPVASGSVGSGITTVGLTGLVVNTTYDFYVQAQCTGNESPWAGPLNFTANVFVCSPPTALTIVDVTDTTAEISWTASTVETGGYAWYVFADGDDPLTDPSLFNGIVATGITTVTVSGLTAATNFDVYISTLCIAGLESSLAGPLNVLTDAAPVTVCDVPTNLMLTNVTDTTANFSWSPSPDETVGYSWVVMLMGDDPNTDPPADQGTVTTGVTSATATLLTPTTMYHAYVKTICDLGAESDFSSLLQFTTDQQMSVHDNEMIKLSYFPNPTSGILTLDARNVIESVEVFTLNGKRVLLKHENQQSVQLDLSGLAQGVYILKAYIDGGVVEAFSIIKK